MGTTSATVETLTAEVRVLMVGNRQITLSVYRQLDTVKLDEIEPFGRVNDNKDVPSDALWIIGAHCTTGALVRSFCAENLRRSGASWSTFDDWVRAVKKRYGAWESATHMHQRTCECGSPGQNLSCDEWWEANPRPSTEIDYLHFCDQTWEPNPLHVEWSELPLIVLAGLR